SFGLMRPDKTWWLLTGRAIELLRPDRTMLTAGVPMTASSLSGLPAAGVIAWRHCESTSGALRPRTTGNHLFHISLRSRCTAMLAGLRTLIQTRRGPAGR